MLAPGALADARLGPVCQRIHPTRPENNRVCPARHLILGLHLIFKFCYCCLPYCVQCLSSDGLAGTRGSCYDRASATSGRCATGPRDCGLPIFSASMAHLLSMQLEKGTLHAMSTTAVVLIANLDLLSLMASTTLFLYQKLPSTRARSSATTTSCL